MSAEPRLEAEPIARILSPGGAVVGLLYKWNNGDLTPMWIEKKIAKVTYEQFVRATRINGVNAVHDTSKLE